MHERRDSCSGCTTARWPSQGYRSDCLLTGAPQATRPKLCTEKLTGSGKYQASSGEEQGYTVVLPSLQKSVYIYNERLDMVLSSLAVFIFFACVYLCWAKKFRPEILNPLAHDTRAKLAAEAVSKLPTSKLARVHR